MTIEIGTNLYNSRSGEEITTTMDHEQAFGVVAQNVGASHWLSFWVHKLANELVHGNRLDDVAAVLGHAFTYAIGQGLKRPRIRVAHKDVRYHFYLSRRGTLCIKAADRREPEQNLWHAEEYVGCIWQGVFKSSHTRDRWEEFLEDLAAADNLARFLANASKDLGACCYCNLPLDDPRSKAVGYGATCAKRWGLPWGRNAEYAEKAPTIFSLLQDSACRGLFDAIRENPQDTCNWEVASDYLEERGLKRMTPPASYSVVLPA